MGIVYERWTPLTDPSRNHMHIQVIPFEASRAGQCREALEASVKQHMAGAKLKRVSAHSEVVEHLGDDSATPYIYFEIPGDNTAKGRQVERYVYAATSKDQPRIPLNFGRQVIC